MKNDLNPFANQDVILKTIKETMRRENELRGYARINFINDFLGQLASNKLKSKQDIEKWLLKQKENAKTIIKQNQIFKDPIVCNMTELKQEHFEVIDKNKQKAREQQRDMRDQLAVFVLNCSVYELTRLYDEYKRLKKNK